MNLQSVKQRFGIIGRSHLLDRALNTAVRVSDTDLSVLIQGESGVGKEVFSRIIHELSVRRHNSFIAVNCGAIPSGTINSELFGHEKGAFTGAISERKGYFETVNGGTIFLDEIGEMPLDTQSFLLRVLESGEFIRVGSSKVLHTDVRIVAATNVNLEEKVQLGKFREDLFYRLNTVPVRVPALHERREDIYMLFRKFAGDFAEKYRVDSISLTPEAREVFENYRWPGNIRELKNLVEQLSVLVEKREVDVEELLDLAPQLNERLLPAKGDFFEKTKGSGFQEREILFKFLFEMKNDINDMKSLIHELVNANNLVMPDNASLKNIMPFNVDTNQRSDLSGNENTPFAFTAANQPIIIHRRDTAPYHEEEAPEEILSLVDMEKEMIKKALRKYNNRRKDAAAELGISERTLYRKIKEYDIDE